MQEAVLFSRQIQESAREVAEENAYGATKARRQKTRMKHQAGKKDNTAIFCFR